jgi:hypothetical protein
MAVGEWEAIEGIEGIEGLESESEAEGGRGRAPKRPSGQPSFKPRPGPGTPAYVTQTQLEAALARSDSKIKTVADGVQQISSRVGALVAATKKEVDTRKKSVDNQSKDLNQKLQMLALLPLLVSPPKHKSPGIMTGASFVANTFVPLVDQDTPTTAIKNVAGGDSTLDALLPLLLVTGMGSPSGLGVGGDTTTDSSMMMLALVLAMTNK